MGASACAASARAVSARERAPEQAPRTSASAKSAEVRMYGSGVVGRMPQMKCIPRPDASLGAACHPLPTRPRGLEKLMFVRLFPLGLLLLMQPRQASAQETIVIRAARVFDV